MKKSNHPNFVFGQGKKGVSANILRRMSTSTWTTTTSATGMPTLEPQPHTRRRRSASFRSSALGKLILHFEKNYYPIYQIAPCTSIQDELLAKDKYRQITYNDNYPLHTRE